MSTTRNQLTSSDFAAGCPVGAAAQEAYRDPALGPVVATIVDVGVSVRTVHTHFPNRESQIAAVGEWFDRQIFPNGFVTAQNAYDLPRYFRDIHRMALASPVSKALSHSAMTWPEVRQRRRQDRLDAIRSAVRGIGAPRRMTEDATALLLSLSGADASWPLHDLYGLPLDRIPDVIAGNVRLIVEDLKQHSTKEKT